MSKIISKECTVGRKWWSEDKPKEVYYEGGSTENGYCFKDDEAFSNKTDEICYIPEYSLIDWEETQKQSDEYVEVEGGYTYQHILDACDGVPTIAGIVYNTVDWQCPETYLNELDEQDYVEDIFMLVAEKITPKKAEYLASIYDEDSDGTDWHCYYEFYLKHKDD